MILQRVERTPENVARIETINAEAFPDNERIAVSDMFGGIGDMESVMLGLYEEARLVGFISMLCSTDCVYIGYFAIEKESRARGFGGDALRQLLALYPDHQVIVDFEAPDATAENNEQRVRRREFYLRSGFYSTGYYQWYMQTEFEIACSRPKYDRAAFERMVALIHASIPQFNPKQYTK